MFEQSSDLVHTRLQTLATILNKHFSTVLERDCSRSSAVLFEDPTIVIVASDRLLAWRPIHGSQAG